MNIKKVFVSSVIFFLFFTLLFAEKNYQTVRVGYYENEVFQEGAAKSTVKAGYAYDYYQKLAEYTGWRYEYVYGNYNDLYNMLLEGKIDFLAGLAWKKEREGLIGYPSLSMGTETYYLLKHTTDTSIIIDDEYSLLNGKVIGIINSSITDALNDFLTLHHIEAAVVNYPDYKKLFESFNNNIIDIAVAESDGTYGRDNVDVLCEFGNAEYYLCVNIKRQDLLSQLDMAQKLLNKEEPNFLNALHAKYFPFSISSRAFSDAEKEWIAAHKDLKVGYLNNYLPYSDMDESKNVTGIVKELFPEIFNRLGIKDMEISYTAYNSYSKMISAVSLGEVDVIFPVGGGIYYSEENGIYQSNVVCTSPTELVYNSNYEEEKTVFAVNKNNTMQYYYILANFPEAQIIFYDSIEACLNAVLTKKVTCTTINGLRNELLRNRKYRNLKIKQLEKYDDRSFGIKVGNERLLRLLNRGINVIGSTYAQNLAYTYSKKLYSYSAGDYLIDNIGFIIIIILIIALFILFLFKNKKRTKQPQN